MKFKTAYSFAPDTGLFIGLVKAWQSPMEAGVYLLPMDSTFEMPGEAEYGKLPRWNGKEWEMVEFMAPENLVDERVIRLERNRLLSESDWTQLADVNLSADEKTHWNKYRQDLRDITKQDEYPKNIKWPLMPR